jgi:hypothetical protein
VLIFYAGCNELNFFANDDRVRHVVDMCEGFCRLFDWMQRCPFPDLRNFPLPKGTPVSGDRTVCSKLQEEMSQSRHHGLVMCRHSTTRLLPHNTRRERLGFKPPCRYAMVDPRRPYVDLWILQMRRALTAL